MTKKTKEITSEIITNTYTQKVLFRFLVGSLMVMFMVYIYIIGSITFNVIARKSLENTARTLGSNISQLELNYLNNLNNVSKEQALALGFVDVNSNIFATRLASYVAIR